MKILELLKKILYFIIDADWYMYKPQYKIHSHLVKINKTDSDIWPSYPHIHMLDDNIKLNIYTGDLYKISTRKRMNTASDKDMEKLWNDKTFLRIVIDARKNKPINVGKLEEIPFKWIDKENIEWIEKNE